MKKNILLSISLSVIALAAIFVFANTYSAEDKLLKENVAALADDWNNPMNLIEEGEDFVRLFCQESDGTGTPGWARFCANGCSKMSWGHYGGTLGNC